MRLYITTGVRNGSIVGRAWDGTQLKAKDRRKAFEAAGYREVQSSEDDVPTDKDGLLAYLNDNFGVKVGGEEPGE